jgi:hypothetical protein
MLCEICQTRRCLPSSSFASQVARLAADVLSKQQAIFTVTKDSFLQEWRSVSVHLACPADFRRSDNDRLKLSKGAVQTSLRTLREQSMRKMTTEADENVWVALRVLELADLEKPDQALAVIVKHHQSLLIDQEIASESGNSIVVASVSRAIGAASVQTQSTILRDFGQSAKMTALIKSALQACFT